MVFSALRKVARLSDLNFNDRKEYEIGSTLSGEEQRFCAGKIEGVFFREMRQKFKDIFETPQYLD